MVIRTHEVMIVNNGVTQIGLSFKEAKNGKRVAVFECCCGRRFVNRIDKAKSSVSGVCSRCRGMHSESRLAHGKTGSPTYISWASMIARCKSKPGSHHWKYYGAKGITVCNRWFTFVNFLEDMGERPDGCTIDRIDGSKGYSKENCRWATKSVQCLNVSDIRMIEFNGVTKCLKDWARSSGIKYATLWMRLNSGWEFSKAIGTPARKTKQACAE